ncbi:hypothetical protein ACFFRR_006087 [Megaselia abdita]
MTDSTVKVNLNMFSQELLNSLVDSIEQISRIEKEKSLIQDRIVRKKGTIAEDALSSDDEIVSKTISRATAEIEDRYFNSTSNSNAEDVKPKQTFGSISTIAISSSDEEYFSAESNSDEDIAKIYNETYLFQQPIPRPRSEGVFESKKFIIPPMDMASLENLLEGEILNKIHEKSILKKTQKFLKRSFSKSLRYLTL